MIGLVLSLALTLRAAGASFTVDVLRVTDSLSMSSSTVTTPTDPGEAMGDATTAGNWASHSEGQTTKALGIASHAEGGWTWATGRYSHSEGLVTRAYGEASHAGGAYAEVSGAHSNALIHATGNGGSYKQTQFKNTAHFDRLYVFENANDSTNSVLSRQENDNRYAQTQTDAVFYAAVYLAAPQGDISMGSFTNGAPQ